MSKKLFNFIFVFLLIFSFPLVVNAGNSDDDQITPVYNVKCEYNLVAAHHADEGASLTTVWVYVDETNSKYKMTYLNNSSQEVDLTDNIYDYFNHDNIKTNYFLKNWDVDFKIFDYHYKNNSNTCPDMYVYVDNNVAYATLPVYNEEYAKYPYKQITVNKKYTSTNGGGVWWSEGGNTSPDDIRLFRDCTYGFLTDIGSATSNPFIVQIKFEKMKNYTKNTFIYNVYITGDNYDRKYQNVLGQEPPMSIYTLGHEATALDNIQLYITEETVKEVLDGTSCLATSNIWSYDKGERGNVKEYAITHDKTEAEKYSLGGIYDGYSGTRFLNARKAYNDAVQALKNAMKTYEDKNWGNKSDETCETLFGGINSGENTLIKNYESAKSTLKSVWSIYDFSSGDEVLQKFKTYSCALSINPGNSIYGCEVIPPEIRNWINGALNLLKYIALVLVIVLGVTDFIKAAASGEADQMKKSGQSFLKRIIAVIILFLLPMLVELILNLIDIYGANSTCLPQ